MRSDESERRRATKDETRKGVIEEVMPNALFKVRLEDGRTVSAGASTELRRVVVRLIAGTKVLVELAKHDPNRGKIIQKL
ncbi:MAG TPA: translation initiation factor IF-1 [Polyangiaceae bacterium]|nr:translation initiation factor IF-1 [Polyangiaceae bacterium]